MLSSFHCCCRGDGCNNPDTADVTVPEKHPHTGANVLGSLGKLECYLGTRSGTQHNAFVFIFVRGSVTRAQTNDIVVDKFNVASKGALSYIENVDVGLVRSTDRRSLPLQSTQISASNFLVEVRFSCKTILYSNSTSPVGCIAPLEKFSNSSVGRAQDCY